MEQSLHITFRHYERLADLPAEDLALVERAAEATARAYAPYSNFRVGAATRLSGGEVVSATNIESEAFPSGMCAERSLLYYCSSAYAGQRVQAIAITSDPSERECYPCGACRQVLLDVERRQGGPIRIIMAGGGTATVVESAESLLPFNFKL